MSKVNITSPVGRIVMGSLYEPNTTDAEGKALVIKNGPNAGQPRSNYFFALAIPKGAEPHWAHTEWGNKIWVVGNQAFPNVAQSEDFSWKIVDGDSQKPGKIFQGKIGKKPCENEGWPGHWVIKFSAGFAPKVYQAEGSGYVQVMQKDFVKPGYFAEVAFSVEGNSSANQPGVYLNHSMVCFRAYGQEITFGPNVADAGFGQSALPPGASMTPPPGAIPPPLAPAVGIPATATPAPPMVNAGLPPLPAYPVAPVGVNPGYAPPVAQQYPAYPAAPSPLPPGGSVPTPAAPATIAPAPIPVIPNPQFLQVPPPKRMTAAANGVPYEAYIAQNWTDALLVQHGLMLA